MKATALALIGAFALCGCTRHTNQESAPAAKPDAGSAAARAPDARAPAAGASAAGAAQAPSAAISASADRPSYEVAIASAQADRVRALNGCDDKQGAPRAACVRQADSAYSQARDAAEKIRGNER